LIAPFMPRPGRGACPACGMQLISNGIFPLLCPRCAAYSRVEGKRLQLESLNASRETPLYAAALPWDDIVGVKKETIALSAHEYAGDVARERNTKNKGLRELDSWPAMCCVCGGHATRTSDHAVPVLLRGPAKAILAARAIPYCGQHKDGVE